VVIRQHNVWCVWVAFCVDSTALHTERHSYTPNVMLPYHHNWPFTLKKLNSVTLTRNIRTPWRWS